MHVPFTSFVTWISNTAEIIYMHGCHQDFLSKEGKEKTYISNVLDF
jgi:hypothetical protein